MKKRKKKGRKGGKEEGKGRREGGRGREDRAMRGGLRGRDPPGGQGGAHLLITGRDEFISCSAGRWSLPSAPLAAPTPLLALLG